MTPPDLDLQQMRECGDALAQRAATLIRTARLPDGSTLTPAQMAAALGFAPGAASGVDAHGIRVLLMHDSVWVMSTYAFAPLIIAASDTNGLHDYLMEGLR